VQRAAPSLYQPVINKSATYYRAQSVIKQTVIIVMFPVMKPLFMWVNYGKIYLAAGVFHNAGNLAKDASRFVNLTRYSPVLQVCFTREIASCCKLEMRRFTTSSHSVMGAIICANPNQPQHSP
jgi:hypothetical protein